MGVGTMDIVTPTPDVGPDVHFEFGAPFAWNGCASSSTTFLDAKLSKHSKSVSPRFVTSNARIQAKAPRTVVVSEMQPKGQSHVWAEE